ncbi:tyrosine-type recombinase/integrase [Clostridium sp. Marseille-P299]|uniref:tyrosine-type recombinase/integrase n=1 Tax=Clostridium sp. Marseille-P299 TaxID=1805477 RepID=UPI00082B7853|nr:site-specific integrase [Clostridium sp. Marseille-P299]
MASIRKRGNSYQITVSNGYDVSGKKILETTTYTPDITMTPKQQQKALETFVFEFEQRVKNGKVLKGEKITLKEFIEQWMKEYALTQLEETTIDHYQHQLDTKIIPALGHIKLNNLKPLHLQSFYNNLLEDGVRSDGKSGGYSYSSIKKIHAILSSILSTAVQWQIIESNPCDRVSPPKQSSKEQNIKHFTLEQAETFLNALNIDYVTTYKAHTRIDDTGKKYKVPEYTESRSIPTQFKVFYNIAIFGGLRKGEILALTWDDIDFNNNKIQINKSTAYANGKVITKDPKNLTSNRTIKLPKSVIELIKQHKLEQMEYRLSLGDQWINGNYLFTQWNGKQMHPSTPYHTFKDIINKYNKTVNNDSEKLPEIPLHGLRHTSATLLIADNIDIRTVSARLGHAQTSTTMNIYAHALKETDEKAANSLEDRLIKKSTKLS